MTDTILDLLKDCVRIGISIEEFWTLDFNEIQIYFDAYIEREREYQKERANLAYRQAGLTAEFVSLMFGGKNAPTLFDAFPGLFKDEEKQYQQNQDKVYEQQMLAWAESWNARLKKGEDNGTTK